MKCISVLSILKMAYLLAGKSSTYGSSKDVAFSMGLKKESTDRDPFAWSSQWSPELKGLSTLVGGMFLGMVLGDVHLWNEINIYITSYLHYFDNVSALVDRLS